MSRLNYELCQTVRHSEDSPLCYFWYETTPALSRINLHSALSIVEDAFVFLLKISHCPVSSRGINSYRDDKLFFAFEKCKEDTYDAMRIN